MRFMGVKQYYDTDKSILEIHSPNSQPVQDSSLDWTKHFTDCWHTMNFNQLLRITGHISKNGNSNNNILHIHQIFKEKEYLAS